MNEEFSLNEYLMSFRDYEGFGLPDKSGYPRADRIVCKDGFSLSVQASQGAYCTPRDNIGPWSKVEVGFPSSAPELIGQWAEDPDHPTDTVYGYVPIKLVEELIELHGGVV